MPGVGGGFLRTPGVAPGSRWKIGPGGRHWAAVQLLNKNRMPDTGCGAAFHADTQGPLSPEHIRCSGRIGPVPVSGILFLFSSCRRKPTAGRPDQFPTGNREPRRESAKNRRQPQAKPPPAHSRCTSLSPGPSAPAPHRSTKRYPTPTSVMI